MHSTLSRASLAFRLALSPLEGVGAFAQCAGLARTVAGLLAWQHRFDVLFERQPH